MNFPILHEKLRYENPLVPMRIFLHQKPDGYLNFWHCHKQIEMLYILEGGLDVYIDKEMYPLMQGDLVIIGSNELHQDYSRLVKYFVFQFDFQQYIDPANAQYIKFFLRMNLPLSKLNYIFAENAAAKQAVIQSIEHIYKEASDKQSGYELAISMHIRQIFLTLLRSDTRNILQIHDQKEFNRLKPVLDFIEQNLNRKLEIKDACAIANISYHHFIKCFKKVTGMSFVDYVNDRRIKMAERILLTEDISNEQVAELIGMENMGHFYKIFRRFNQCSPNEFRKKMMEWGRP
ncbi:helix-turn-helix domain-containing protein [Paenibacillus allorhizosphaerae]|uniref:HTH-type transcriptional activator RhaR n=1 Tax=Paenibacillus allorhizosphaerae TaxID=2849866 RepID=A0ABM8VIE0_9BACL|nr:AraC family transcriptional regulator [Paenibacillus allorhizosphaerae]CAG7643842.1 HTH-type transcriptional activator RhaR [Paenibacillus allorhizosphaerae]